MRRPAIDQHDGLGAKDPILRNGRVVDALVDASVRQLAAPAGHAERDQEPVELSAQREFRPDPGASTNRDERVRVGHDEVATHIVAGGDGDIHILVRIVWSTAWEQADNTPRCVGAGRPGWQRA